MGGRIDCYVDVASLYGYLCLVLLRRDAARLAAHNVEIVFHPVLLGGINLATGNQSPFMLPAKAKYGVHDVRRSCVRAGVPETRAPRNFFERANPILALRALHHIQQHFSTDAFVTAFHYLFYRFWTPPNADLRHPDGLRTILAEVPVGFGAQGKTTDHPTVANGALPQFTPAEASAIVQAATEQLAKDLLSKTTQEAIDRGAFGTPWLWVCNSAGQEEPFFGSDRFHFVYQFLGLPYQDVALLEPSATKSNSNPKL